MTLVGESEDLGFKAGITLYPFCDFNIFNSKTVNVFYIPSLFIMQRLWGSIKVYKWLSWKELLCNINMPWKGVEKAQNICFSKHENVVISYGKREGRQSGLPPPMWITLAALQSLICIFSLCWGCWPEILMWLLFVVFSPKMISLFSPPINVVANTEIQCSLEMFTM